MSGIGVGVGLHFAPLVEASGEPPVTAQAPTLTRLPDGALEIEVNDGLVSITVLAPSPFAGTYTTTTNDLATAPVNLVPPQITGTPVANQRVLLEAGLWAYDAAHPAPVVSYQWYEEGAALVGETFLEYILPINTGALSGVETLTQEGTGERSLASNIAATVPLSQVVTVPAGTVQEDIADFPMCFDLQDLSPALWDNLRPDGGNLRATTPDGKFTYPLDIVWIDPLTRQGKVFVRLTLFTALNVDFTWQLRSTDTAAASATDPDGQHAVWADYLSVLAFPERTDRTGNFAVSETGALTDSFTATQVSDHINMHQGVAFDGSHWFVVDTNLIKKFDTNWTLVQTLTNPIATTGIAGVNHLGDPCIFEGELLIPLELWPSGPFTNQHIVVFNTDDLSFVRSHDISAAGREASSVDYDPTTDRFYVTDYTDGSDILRFRTEWIPDGSLSLSQDVPKIQGISFHKGKMYLTSDTADDLYEVDLGGTVTPTPLYRSKFGGNFEGITSDGNTLYVLIDSTVSAVFKLVPSATSDLLELGGGEFLQVPNIPAQETWTFSITGSTHLFTRNNALASLNSTNSDRATAVMRESSNPSEWSAWDNENGWMGPSQGQSVALLDPHRIALAYDGTSGRKISLDGLPYAAQSGIQARPGGTEHTWYIGAGNDTGKEFLTGAVSFAFLFGGYASDARLAAEYATLHDTRNFYLPL